MCVCVCVCVCVHTANHCSLAIFALQSFVNAVLYAVFSKQDWFTNLGEQ